MSALTLFIFALALVCMAFASPINGTTSTLEKRVTHTGRVSALRLSTAPDAR